MLADLRLGVQAPVLQIQKGVRCAERLRPISCRRVQAHCYASVSQQLATEPSQPDVQQLLPAEPWEAAGGVQANQWHVDRQAPQVPVPSGPVPAEGPVPQPRGRRQRSARTRPQPPGGPEPPPQGYSQSTLQAPDSSSTQEIPAQPSADVNGSPSRSFHPRRLSQARWGPQISACYTLGEVNHLFTTQYSRLQLPDVAALLQKAIEFADTDPRYWFTQPGLYIPQGGGPRRPVSPSADTRQATHRSRARSGSQRGRQHAEPPSDVFFDEEYHNADWGMSDEDGWDARGGAPNGLQPWGAGLLPRPPPPLSPKAQRASADALLALVHRAAKSAAWHAKQRQLAPAEVSSVLSLLAKLGYCNQVIVMQLLDSCQAQLVHGSPSALASIVGACGALQLSPPAEWLGAWEKAVCSKVTKATGGEVAFTVSAIARLGYRPSSQCMSALCARSMRCMPTCQPRDLARLASGLATVRHQPCSNWMATFLAASASQLQHFTLQELQQTLTALASLSCRPSAEWLAGFYARCQQLLETAPAESSGRGSASAPQRPAARVTTRQMASMTASLARLGCRPDMHWLDVCLGNARQDFPQASLENLVRLLAALSALRYRPGEGWMQAYLAGCFSHLHSITPDMAVALVQSLALLGHRPPDIWMHDFVRKCQGRLHAFNGDQLGAMLFSFVRLDYRPPPEWLSAWEGASHSTLDAFSADALASSVWAMAQMRYQPAVSWLYSFVLAAYSRLDAFGAGQLGAVFDSLPQIAPHPGWLDELVQICASESSSGTGRGLVGATLQLSEAARVPCPYEEGQDCMAAVPPAAAANGVWQPDSPAGTDSAAQLRTGPLADTEATVPTPSPTGFALWYKMPASSDRASSDDEPMTLRIYGLNGEEEIVTLGGSNGAARAPVAVRAGNGDGSGVPEDVAVGVVDVAARQRVGGAPLAPRRAASKEREYGAAKGPVAVPVSVSGPEPNTAQ